MVFSTPVSFDKSASSSYYCLLVSLITIIILCVNAMHTKLQVTRFYILDSPKQNMSLA